VAGVLNLKEKKYLVADDIRSYFKNAYSLKKQKEIKGFLSLSLPDQGIDLEKEIGHLERRLILQALHKSRGFKKKAAGLLGLSLRSFRYRLQKYNLDFGEEKD